MAIARQRFCPHLAPATILTLVLLLSSLGITPISAAPRPAPAGPPEGPSRHRSLPDFMRRNVVEPDIAWRRTAAASAFAFQNAAEEPSVRVNTYTDTVEGYLAPDASAACEVFGATLKGSGNGSAGADGWLQPVYCGADIVPGDRVHVSVEAGGQLFLETDLVAPGIQAQLEPGTDRISGQVTTDYPLPSRAIVWVWSEGRQTGADLDVTVAADGTFSADFSSRFDVLAGDWAMVWLAPGSDWIGQELPAL
ncbi:MAG: hypothetical protein ACM30E_08520, partial [Nitrososphaerales archaeon]